MIKFLKSIKLTVWLFLLGEFLDGVTTAIGLYVGGREGNPLVNLGWNSLIAIKIIAVLLVALALQYRVHRKWMEWSIVIAGSIIVPWNVYTIISYLLV